MLVLSLRLLVYSLLSNPWHVLYAEALHGVTFALMWAAVANHANAIAPVGLSASVQGLVGSMNFGIGECTFSGSSAFAFCGSWLVSGFT